MPRGRRTSCEKPAIDQSLRNEVKISKIRKATEHQGFSITDEGVIFLIPAGMTPISRAVEERSDDTPGGHRMALPTPVRGRSNRSLNLLASP